MPLALIVTMNVIAMLAGAGLTLMIWNKAYKKLHWVVIPMSGGLVLSLFCILYLVQLINVKTTVPLNQTVKQKLQRHNIADPDTNMWFKIDTVTSTTLSVIPIAKLNKNKVAKIEGSAPAWEDETEPDDKTSTRNR